MFLCVHVITYTEFVDLFWLVARFSEKLLLVGRISNHSFDGYDSEKEESRSTVMKELKNYFRERIMDFKLPKF